MIRMILRFAFVLGLVVPSALSGQGYTVVHSFVNEGGTPYSGLVQAPDGKFYGTDTGGGLWGHGSVFVIAPDGGGGFTFETLYSFSAGEDGANPEAGLLLASDGNLYGTTYTGGPSAPGGTVFRMDTLGDITILHQFFGYTDGYNPSASLIQANDGKLYGVTESGHGGTVFQLDLDGTFATIYTFAAGPGPGGRDPRGALVQGADGKLYGTTFAGGASDVGTIFRISTDGAFEKLSDIAGSSGQNPAAGLVIGPDGNFYGTTEYGAGFGGSLFRADTSGSITWSQSIGGYPLAALIVAEDGNLYGTTDTSVYQLTTAGVVTTLKTFADADGFGLRAPLIQAQNGLLYGTAAQGGLGLGTAFRLSTAGDEFEIVHAFSGAAARNPQYALFQTPDGSIVGAAGGGQYGLGTVFRLDPAGNETVLHAFSVADGSTPEGLIRMPDGTLFGTAADGGANGKGTVFRIDNGLGFGVVHTFSGDDGSQPTGLTLALDGTVFGATYNLATVFHIDALLAFSTVHTLSGSDGSGIDGRFVQLDDGSFIGTAYSGGAGDLGTVFRFDASGDFEVLHSFSGWDGAGPVGPLVKAPDGNYYGLTGRGGTNNLGTIYRMDPTGRVTSIHSFTASEGIEPYNGLIVADDGNLYGATLFGPGNSAGTVFRSDLSGNVTVIHTFMGIDGNEPLSQVFQGLDAGLYGATRQGGLFDGGVVYRISLPLSLSISRLDPSSGPSTGGTSVTAYGFHFSGSTVTIGGVPATDVVVQDQNVLTAVTPALPPGTLNDFAVTNFNTATGVLARAWLSDFLDVAGDDPFHSSVESVFRNGITAGCGGGNYCRNAAVTRAQMAVLLLKTEHGQGYAPPPCAGVFQDVACPSQYADWIEELAAEQITSGCGAGNYCPDVAVRRDQVAVFLLKTQHGSSYVPPACANLFADVACPGQFADWIEEIYAEGVTGGCGTNPLIYCPLASVTRGQMAVFLTKTFNLQ